MLYLPEKCLRNSRKCEPLSQIQSENGFICMGRNDGSERKVDQDIFTVCWKNAEIDEETHWDERDIIDHVSILMQGLSAYQNLKLLEPDPK